MHETIFKSSRINYNGINITKVPTELGIIDHIGGCKARWNINRMTYTIEPKLYAVGNPGSTSPVLATANYKLSFDSLRKNLINMDAWILVLDTKGINVWCAAGKGTFSTDELINKINQTKLKEIVEHNKIIVPQLGAPGVCGFEVTKYTGFNVVFGPVRAEDLPAFITNNYQATPEMRKVKFSTLDRLTLVPVELVIGLKYLLLVSLCFLLIAGLNPEGYSATLAIEKGVSAILILLSAYLSGTIFGPLLLPVLPAKAFAFKGAILGVFCTLLIELSDFFLNLHLFNNYLDKLAWLLLITAINSFIVMNFTGTSTYTSLSGVRKEMKIAVPIQIACFILGTALWIVSLYFT